MTGMSRISQSPIVVLAAGLVIFLVGLGLAIANLPEWSLEPLPEHELFQAKANEALARLGLRKLDDFNLALTEQGSGSPELRSEREQLDQYLGSDAASWLERRGRTFYVLADTQVENEAGKQLSLDLKFSIDGELVSVTTVPDELGMGMFEGSVTPGLSHEQVVSILLRDGETLGQPREIGFFGADLIAFPVYGRDGAFSESIQLNSPSNFPMLVATRLPATPDQIEGRKHRVSIAAWLRAGWKLAARVGLALGIVALLAVLVTRRSVGLRNGLVFAGIQFLLVIPPVIRGQQQLLETIVMDLFFLISVFIIFIGWSAAESWYRILSDEPTTGVDHLRERILGHGEGQSLLAGWGTGAAIAGALLIFAVIAKQIPVLSQTSLSVDLSSVYGVRNPWFSGLAISIAVLMAYCAALRWCPPERRHWVALFIGSILLVPLVDLAPFPVAMVVAVGVTWLLLWTLRTYHLLGLLASSVTILALPLAAFALVHPVWQPLELLVTGGISTAPLLLGFVGLRRLETERRERVATPMFMRRLEHERRLRYEMDLLARMQLGLLPDSPSGLDGWDIAVRSVLPTEVGGDFYEFIEDDEGFLWVAMGDVSGHGYQCSIVHAMTKAALLSLVSSKLTPGEIMDRLDQVLRHSGTARTFVALALMRIDLQRGEIDYSNAASPFPIVVTDNEITEIEISTLPLGHGPVQAYSDHRFIIEPGSAIVFWSDGLYEARNNGDDEYGYDRPGTTARGNLQGDAETILEAIFSDWTAFRGDAELEDDTTVLVIKRG